MPIPLLEHLVLGTEGSNLAAGQDQKLIEGRQCGRPMGNHDADAAARPDRSDRLGERRFALSVEVGVRLVQHDQEGIAIERPGQRHPLPLTCRKDIAALANSGFVTLRKTHDHGVHAGRLCGSNDALAAGVGIEAGDVFSDRSVEQLDVLRQVADMLAKDVRAPLVESGSVEADVPRSGCQAPTSARASVDLPEAEGPITPRPAPAVRENETPCSMGCCCPGAAAANPSTSSRWAGLGNSMISRRAGRAARSRDKRARLWRAEMKPRQLARARQRT